VEVLKQNRNTPIPVELQVVIIYAVIHNFLKKVDVEDVTDYQNDLFAYMQTHHLQLLQNIVSTGDLSKDDDAALRKALEEFTEKFLTQK